MVVDAYSKDRRMLEHAGISGLVDRIVLELADERARAQRAVQAWPTMQKIRRERAAARLKQMYDDYQHDWLQVNSAGR